MTRLYESRPYMSVPNQWALPGGRSRWPGFISIGSDRQEQRRQERHAHHEQEQEAAGSDGRVSPDEVSDLPAPGGRAGRRRRQ